MEHLHSRMPYAQWRLQVFYQLFLSSGASSSAFLSRRVHSSSSYNAEPSTREANINNTNKNHDNEANPGSTKRFSQLLPQSPLITNPNPGLALRHRKKRLPTADDLSEIRNNPWAVALASPVRMCNVTGTRMPRALLTEWGLVEEPARESTSELDAISAAASDTNSNAESNTQVHTPRPKRLEKKFKDNKLWILPLSLLKDDVVKEGKDNRPHLKFRMLDRNYILQTITNANGRKTKQKNFIANLVPHRWKPPLGPLNAEHQKRLAWRADMPDFVLEVKRREVLKHLKHVSDALGSKNKSHARWMSFDVQKPYSGETLVEGLMTEALAGKEVPEGLESGVFLVLGDGSGAGGAGDADEAAAFPEFVALPGSSRKVPIFNLTRLLSQAELEEIRTYHDRFQKFGAFFKPSRQLCIDAVLALWNLEGYVREATG
ncbi:hypothetical protein BDV11DRAFT_214723 [Aspergillus similis]